MSRTEHLYVRGDAYGVESSMVDGNDVLAVRRRAQEAAQLCLAGNGPALIEAVTYRHGGHHVNDPGAYMPREKLDYYRRKDPILIGRNYLLEVAGEDEIAALEESVDKELEEAVISARSETEPDAAEFLKELENY